MQIIKALQTAFCIFVGLGIAANSYAGDPVSVPEPDMLAIAAAGAIAVALIRKFRRK